MSADALAAIEDVLGGEDEPDDALRATVAVLAAEPGIAWAGIAFREEDALVLGPEAGEADPAARVRVPVTYEDAEVGELWADGAVERTFLERVAALVAPYVLIGWDTGGRSWEP